MRRFSYLACSSLFLLTAVRGQAAEPPAFEEGVQTILLAKCGSCHGNDRSRRKAELDLSSASTILKGAASGAVIENGKPDESLLWQMIEAGEMPPANSPALTDEERDAIRTWIAGGAKFRDPQPQRDEFTPEERNFWAFRPLSKGTGPASESRGSIDHLIETRLKEHGLNFADEADRRTLCRRIYLDLIGLPPSPEQLNAFLQDESPQAYSNLVEQLLSSPHHGERWGRQWLDVVGYADSNGYIRHDSPRPLAWRYRDYVIDSLNRDVPYDQFWREQLAGDELVEYPRPHLSPDELRTLTATHFLRNAPDGTDNTEGNEITRVMERYAVLEAQLQITMSAMFGMTIDCARCHSHKFDPIPHRDYYALQAVFYPAFNVKNWTQPMHRWIHAAGEDEIQAWRASVAAGEQQIAELRSHFDRWLVDNPSPSIPEWSDDFSGSTLQANWSHTAPGDDHPAGHPPLQLDGSQEPAASVDEGGLILFPAASGSSNWLVTQRKFDWSPDSIGQFVQFTFDLVRDRSLDDRPAERIGYYISLHDHDDSSKIAGGNLLVDGNPEGGSRVLLDYPGQDAKDLGALGHVGYVAGRNYGIRITRSSEKQLLLQHLVNGIPDGEPLTCQVEDLPDGGLGFELCCSRSFAVDNVVVARSAVAPDYEQRVKDRQNQLEQEIAAAKSQMLPEPAKIAWTSDLSPQIPDVPVLKRGDYFNPGEHVEPGVLSILEEPGNEYTIASPREGQRTTGARLAFAQWATRPESRAAALMARVHVDRIWRGHFGTGLVPTPENFGASGIPPEFPELLEFLAADFVRNGWSQKELHRQIVLSRTYRQSSVASDHAVEVDSVNILYSRFPAHRLDAEQIRDATLTVAGLINLQGGGEPVDFVDQGNRQIVLPVKIDEGPHPSDRRSVYIRYRRSQPLTFLQVFDEAAPDPNCIARSSSTVVGQSLTMLNSLAAVRASRQFAVRVEREAGEDSKKQITHAFVLAYCRTPTEKETEAGLQFLVSQRHRFAESKESPPARMALAELCKVLMASNEFLQLQ
ncbi:PSD1 and planctomycete cytochrome C domain-containing protein [Planctomicrobium sp. SH661]|uniref:PSD1 and planctomycete cytochrome C domain-containing protein n=1 Tax=Planctomicrobium sp. SH661 TaxID=3448124 RepID=UPI003F5AF899